MARGVLQRLQPQRGSKLICDTPPGQTRGEDMEDNMASKLSDSLEGKGRCAEAVNIKLPLIRGGEDSVRVGVDGRFWQIKRGVRVDIPMAVYEVLQHQEDMELQAQEYEDTLANRNSGMDTT